MVLFAEQHHVKRLFDVRKILGSEEKEKKICNLDSQFHQSWFWDRIKVKVLGKNKLQIWTSGKGLLFEYKYTLFINCLLFLESLIIFVDLLKAEPLPIHIHEVGDVLHVQAGLVTGLAHPLPT